MSIEVSIVVPTYNRSGFLERCIRALCTQNFEPDAYEIIIVDDAISDKIRQQIDNHAREQKARGLSIRYLPTSKPRSGPGAARNIGWKAARSKIIAFTDDDCIPEMSWLRNGVNAFTDEITAISGRIIVPLQLRPTDYEHTTANLLEKSEFSTANCFCRRSALEQVGGFDERFTSAWREDSDLFFTLLEHGHCCISEKNAVVLHPARPERWGISLRQQRKSLFDALLYRKHPRLYREIIQSVPPWRDYCILSCLCIALLGLLLHLWLLTDLAMLLWLYMTVRFCQQRLHKTSRAPKHIVEVIITSILIPSLAIFWRLWGALKYRVLFL